MKIRAAVLEEFGKPLVVQDVELAGPKAGEVLVRVEACGVCHTDLYTASGADPTGYAPCVLGHEGAGVVEDVGEGVTSVRRGDRVITLFAPECGRCIHCLSPRTNRCIAIREQQGLGYLPDGTSRLARGDEVLRHFMGTSTFAEATVMPEIALAKVNADVPADGASIFACGLSTGLGATFYTAQVEAGSTCAVFGCGLVGLGAVAGCRLRGAEQIVAIDLSEERLAMARHHGATHTMLAGDGVVDALRELTGGYGCDYTFEATGNVMVMRQAAEAAREAWGLATMIGVAGKGEVLEIVPRLLITGRRVAGSSFGGVKGRSQVPGLVQLWMDGKLDVDSMLSHRMPLAEVNAAFDLMHQQDGIRSILTF